MYSLSLSSQPSEQPVRSASESRWPSEGVFLDPHLHEDPKSDDSWALNRTLRPVQRSLQASSFVVHNHRQFCAHCQRVPQEERQKAGLVLDESPRWDTYGSAHQQQVNYDFQLKNVLCSLLQGSFFNACEKWHFLSDITDTSPV